MPYGYITLGEMRAELLNRLQDSGAVYTTVPEANAYLIEGLRILNAQTAAWPSDYQFDFAPGDTWKTLNVAGSPRQRTITDSDLYDQMEAMLLEPMSGGVWTGTAQYNIAMLSGALQYRRDELLLLSNANVVNLLQTSPVLSVRTYLPDSTLNLSRVRWIPVDSSATMPYALGREDVVTRNAFGVNLPIRPGEPDSWMITANTPLSFDVSCPPNQAGQWDMLVSEAGVPFAPPAAALVGTSRRLGMGMPVRGAGGRSGELPGRPGLPEGKILHGPLRAGQEGHDAPAVAPGGNGGLCERRYARLQGDRHPDAELGAEPTRR